MRHTREFWLERLYARVPAFHREQDLAIARLRSPGLDDGQAAERAPLRSLLRTIAAQVAAVRQDLDDLRDDFFLETAEDWVVPYLGALVGTTLLPNPVGQSNRQDVRNTLAWRRAKGTPAMLAGLARGTTGWGAEVVEGFRTLAWTQHAAHVRLDRPLTADLRDPVALARLGTAHDPFAHLPDFRAPGRSGAAGQGGRYDLGTAVTFLRPLQTFPQRGVTPAAAAPGDPAPAGTRAHTFDPLHEELPLYGADGLPVDPVAFAVDPAAAFGPERSFVVRRAGVPLALAPARGGGDGRPDNGGRGPGAAADAEPEEDFAFGTPEPATGLHPTEGMRVLDPTVFRRPAEHFTVSALWYPDAAPGSATGPVAPVRLGAIATSLLPDTGRAFRTDRPLGGAGRLVVRIETGRPEPLPGWAGLGTADAGRFPACELVVRDDRPPRAARHGGVPSVAGRYAGAVTVHLPEVFVWPGRPVDLLVAADGSTYRAEPPAAGGPPGRGRLARASDGQAWPSAGPARPVTWPYRPDGGVHRVRGLAVADRTRFTGLPGFVVEVHELAAVPQLAGALVTADTPVTEEHRARLAVPAGLTDWPAFTFLPSRDAVADRIPVERTVLVALEIRPAALPGPGEAPAVWPMSELVVTDRAGGALLAYLPEADPVADGDGAPVARFALAADGSGWTMPGGLRPGAPGMLPPGSVPARAAQGQVLPLEGAVPLRRRRVVHGPARSGELGVDPARGVFCLAPDDPLVALPPADRDLTVDYIEAFGGPVGARGVRTAPGAAEDGAAAPTRIVSAAGDAAVRLPFGRIHRTPAEAVAAAEALWAATRASVDEVIEIVDSASYAGPVTLDFGRLGPVAAGLRRHVTIRAGGPAGAARPCLLPETPATGAALVTVRGMTGLGAVEALSVDHVVQLSGLLIGGRIQLTDGFLTALRLDACTLDVPSGGSPEGEADGPAGEAAVRWDDAEADHQAELSFTASILAGVRTGPGVALVTGTDSVLHRTAPGRRPGLALGGPDAPGRTRAEEADDSAGDRPARLVRLRRVTVLGRLRAEELEADEALLAGTAVVDARQSGCLRFSRVEPGSVLPRRHRCVPADDDLARGDTAAPSFKSLRPRSALFAAIGDASSPLVLTASGSGDEVGAFAGGHSGLRRANLAAKLAEFLPAGLRPVIVVEDGAVGRPPGTV
ncbi:hypothetical protein [Kitasatospora sp. A2-31]|uniref:hypothetical protein n=1 Tax=Kitasatospora sp. A2-31 TaxID=2916414 RepID=UPI001EEB569C|nr:hypothetical protein [Kitasatospora sp. A2-31]MCG6495451.1 hypothetical protein [Kitasatospora sp. A2-31]